MKRIQLWTLASIVFFLTLTLARANPVPAPAGLVGWWRGEGNALDTITANSGVNQNATYSNGVVGQAFSFDPENYAYGTYCGIQIADQPAYALTNSLTIEGWIRPRADSYLIFFRGDHRPGLDPYFLGMTAASNISLAITDESGNSMSLGAPIGYFVWTHVAATLDGSSGAMKIYTNGVLAAQTNTTVRPFGTLQSDQSPGIGIGNLNDGGNNFPFIGDVDEISLYNRALTTSEIQSIYNAGSAGKYIANTSGVPVITDFSPKIGNIASVVTLTGTNFSPVAALNIVYFGAVRAVVQSANPTTIVVTVPSGATFAPITVAVNGMIAYSPAAFEPTFAGAGAAIDTTTFAPGVNMNVPAAIATVIADLDGDGKPDLVTANVYNNAVSIYQNVGTNGVLTAASFAAPVVFAAGTGSDNPLSVTVADLDGDGKLDIIVPDRNNNQLIVYRNLSSGGMLTTNSFAPPIYLAVAADPRSVVVRDLDGDGLPDLITANGSGSLSILRNLGAAGTLTTNSFAAHIELALVGGSQCVIAGDLDGDGKPDLAAADGSGLISLFHNHSVPGSISVSDFDARVDLPAMSGSLNVVMGDLDGDGRPELISTAYLPQTISVYRNLSTPGALTTNSFAISADYGLAGRGHTIALGDLNGDGKPDITEVTELDSVMSLFQNVGTGNFTNTSLATRVDYTAGWNAWGVAVGDLDGDGRPDAVFGNDYDNTLTFYKNIAPFSSAVSCTPATPGLVGWWRAEGNANDAIGSDNGSLLGGLGFASGEVGEGFYYSQTNQAVDVPASAATDVGAGSGFTLEAWIKPQDVVQSHPIFEWNDLTYWGVHFNLEPGQPFNSNPGPGELYANIPDSAGNWHQMSSPGGVVATNVFQHIALTYDKASGLATIYCNGQIVAQQNFGSFTPRTANRDLYLGRRPAPSGEEASFSGLIDEPSIYNRALGSNEIAAIYLAGSAGKCYSLLAPFIVSQPTNVTVPLNGTATFNVTAQGTAPLYYQWLFNGTNIGGATNTFLTLANLQATQTGTYSVLVSNLVGMVASSNAVLTVLPPAPPTILSQVHNQVVLLGSPANFTVTAAGSDPLSYFWKRDGSFIAGATNASYTLFNAQLSDSGSMFSCLVTNLYGFALSTNASLKVLDTISNDLCSGAIAVTNYNYTNVESTLRASSFGDPVPDCIAGFGNGVWYQFTAPVNGLLTVDTFGSDFDTGLGIYIGSCDALTEVACNDDTGGVTSQVVLPTLAGTTYSILAGGYSAHAGNLVFHLNYQTPPGFLLQPTNQSIVVSSNVIFSTTVAGTQPITYQWYFNNTPLVDAGRISGSTNLILSIANVVTNDGGNYQIVASNFLGSVTSAVAVLTPIILPPTFLVQPSSQSIINGSNVNFFAGVDGTPPYSYQWYLNGNPLTDDGVHYAGSTTASLSISNLTTTDAGGYSLQVTNVSGATNSNVAVLTVLVAPNFTANPVGRSVPAGLPTIFTAAASGIPAPSFQWQLNGVNIPGATKANYTNTSVGLTNLGFYQVIASNLVGVATSQVAQLTFGPVAEWGNGPLPPPGLSNVVGVAGNINSTYAIRADGTVAAVGGFTSPLVSNIVALAASDANQTYALHSDGTVTYLVSPTPVLLTNIVAISSGYGFAYGLRAEGTLTNFLVGQPPVSFPPNLNHIKAIACGHSSALALRTDGTVVAAGTDSLATVPAGLTNVVAIAAGYSFDMALKADGNLVVWGTGTGITLPAGMSNIIAIAAGNYYQNSGIAIRANGTVVTWGDNTFGDKFPPAALSNWVSIAVSAPASHGLALVNDGSPVIVNPPVGLTAYSGRDVTLQAGAAGAQPLSYTWWLNGTNIPGATNSSLVISNIQFSNAGNYQLFVSNSINTALSLPARVTVVSNNTLFLLSQTTPSVTNLNQGGKFSVSGATVLGSGPLRYQWFYGPTNKNYVPVSGATNDSLLMDPALAVQSGYYYLSISNQIVGVTSAPVNVRVQFAKAWGFQAVTNLPVNVTNAIALATGGYNNFYGHYFALGADGKLTPWANYFAAYGETNVSALSNSFVTAIAAGYEDSLALKSDGTVIAWGYGVAGETNVPGGLNSVVAIACGNYHDLALKADGTVVGWGGTGQFNYGQATNNPAATNVVAIAAGVQHSLALRADGTVVAWGYSFDGSTTIPLTATNVIGIAAGSGFSAALRANGTVVQWGNGIQSYPFPANLSNVVAISAASTHCSALKNDGSVITWGYEYVYLASNNLPTDLSNVVAIASGGDHDIALFGTRAPTFTIQPWNRTVALTKNVTSTTLAGKCAGVQPMSYQWRLNGTNYPGATNDTLTLLNNPFIGIGQPSSQIIPGAYQLVVSNAYGVAISKPAKVTLVIPLGEAVDATNLNWTTSGGAQWYGQTNITHDGLDAARSGGIGASQESILQTTLVTNSAGAVTFWWKVSSEQFFDTLEFRVNGNVQASISGEVDWQQAVVPISVGTNLLQWRYSKDASFDAGLDAGFVDQFAFSAAPVIVSQPQALLTANAGATVSMSIRATGSPTMSYQWRQNGNLVGNNSSSLALSNVGRAQNGNYFVTVTNAGGAAVSTTASVHISVPQLLGTPQWLPNGMFSLISTDSDGGRLSPADLTNFEAQASTNLLDWVSLPGTLSLTNGALLLQDSSPTNFPARYYRIIEH